MKSCNSNFALQSSHSSLNNHQIHMFFPPPSCTGCILILITALTQNKCIVFPLQHCYKILDKQLCNRTTALDYNTIMLRAYFWSCLIGLCRDRKATETDFLAKGNCFGYTFLQRMLFHTEETQEIMLKLGNCLFMYTHVEHIKQGPFKYLQLKFDYYVIVDGCSWIINKLKKKQSHELTF